MDENNKSNLNNQNGYNPYEQNQPQMTNTGQLYNAPNGMYSTNQNSFGVNENAPNYNNLNNQNYNQKFNGMPPYNQNMYNQSVSMNAQNQNKNSGLSIIALVLSIIGCTSFVGLILAIVDLSKKDGKKKTVSIVALSISGIWFLLFLVGLVSGGGKTSKSTTESTTVTSDSVEDITTEEVVNTEEEITESETIEDTTSTEETAETDTKEISSSSEEEYKASCEVLDYESIMRNPSDYDGKKAKVEGKVLQVWEDEKFLSSDVEITLRVAENGDYDKVWYVTFVRTGNDSDRILKDDYITAFGVCKGIKSYTALLGNQVTIPTTEASYIVNRTSEFDAQTIADNLKVTEYRSEDDVFDFYYIVVENTSDYTVDLDASVKYFDESEKLIGTDSGSVNTLASGQKALLGFWPQNADSVQYKLSVSMSERYLPAVEDINYEVSETADKLIVTVKNIGNDKISVEGSVLFFKDGNPIWYDEGLFSDSDLTFESGEEVSREFLCGYEYDSYELFLYPKKSKY